jgi:hypothetical protein
MCYTGYYAHLKGRELKTTPFSLVDASFVETIVIQSIPTSQAYHLSDFWWA